MQDPFTLNGVHRRKSQSKASYGCSESQRSLLNLKARCPTLSHMQAIAQSIPETVDSLDNSVTCDMSIIERCADNEVVRYA